MAVSATVAALPQARAHGFAQSAIVSANPADYTPDITDPPHAGYHVTSIAQIGNEVYVAGEFTQVRDNTSGGVVYNVTGLFAFDVNTGVVDNSGFGFPSVNGRIETLATDGTRLYMGGNFSQTDGKHTKKLVELDPATGAVVTAFKGTAEGKVNDLAIGNGLLYIGGSFTSLDGQPRQGLAAVDLTTGALDGDLNLPVTGTRKSGKPMHVDKIDVSPDGSRLLAAGNFTAVNGTSRDQIVMIDLSTVPDSLANWSTNRYSPNCASRFDTYIRDVEFSPDGSYFVIATTGASASGFGATPTSGQLCDSSARFETSATGSALQPTWVDFVGGDTNYSVEITGTAVYLGGHERWQNNYFGVDYPGPGSVSRAGIASLSPLNGVPFAWNPGRIRGLGAQALLATDAGLFVGSDTDVIGGEDHSKIALMPLAGGEAVPPANPGTLPGDFTTIQQDGTMVARSFDGTTFGAPTTRTSVDWSSARGAFMLSGTLYTGWSNGQLYRQTLNGDTVGTQQSVNMHGLDTETKQSPGMSTQLAGATGMFFDPSNGRLYYTVSGDAHLYYRAFLPESRLLGDYRYVACTWNSNPGQNTCGGLNPGIVRGMTLVGGTIYFGQTSGNLSAVSFTSGATVAQGGTLGATATVLSGPLLDGNDWNSRALFVRSDA
jgi:hypothetical protein